jgi:hypothetical protein
MDSKAVVIVIVVVLVVLALIAVAMWMAARRRQQRTEQLQGRFGPEYERQVEEQGGRRDAESHLSDVAARRDKIDVRELSDHERTGYTHEWNDVQASFVDNPGDAVRDADRLVGEVMRDRGYPVDDFDTKADMVAADHPEIADHYRAAHGIASRTGVHSTEEQRQAFVHYRALFAELLTVGDHGRHATEDGDGQVDLTDREQSKRTSAGSGSRQDVPPTR